MLQIAPKVHVFSDKNTDGIYRTTSNKLWYIDIVRKNCSKSPRFWRQKWTQTIKLTKIPIKPYGQWPISRTSIGIAPKVHVFGDKNTGRIYRATSNKLWYIDIARKNCAKSPRFWRQKWTQTIKHTKIPINPYGQWPVSRTTIGIAPKVHIFSDKNIGGIMPIESDGLWYTSILRKNCSKSPHFQRQKWTQTIKIMKVRRIHGEINPSHWHVPELLRKFAFLATKIQEEFTGPYRTNYNISIS